MDTYNQRQLKFLVYIIKKEVAANLLPTRRTADKSDMENLPNLPKKLG